MQILINAEEAILTLVPATDEESETIAAIAARMKPEEKLKYGGRGTDPEGEDFCTVFLHAGGESEIVEEKVNPNFTVVQRQFTGSTKLELVGTTEDDKYAIGGIRNACYFATGGLIFLGETMYDGKQAINVTAARCKHCSANLIEFGRCEWKTCAKCAEKCEHEYKRGMVHGPGLDMGVGEFCTKCGSGKPREESEREKSVIEQHLAVKEELGMPVFYKNGPPNTPEEAVQLQRLARRHAKANRA
ncbi:hypothetical protein KC865_01295 [Candidatus Kaiserbacteria bacterium]|nr:hypothetical protein [Candidatus Kaiserbacteria bacterium]